VARRTDGLSRCGFPSGVAQLFIGGDRYCSWAFADVLSCLRLPEVEKESFRHGRFAQRTVQGRRFNLAEPR
jgi:hypothetical protein